MYEANMRLNLVDIPEPKQKHLKRTLIFDLDETLAHCVDTEDGHTPEFTRQFSKEPQHIVKIICGTDVIEAGINLVR